MIFSKWTLRRLITFILHMHRGRFHFRRINDVVVLLLNPVIDFSYKLRYNSAPSVHFAGISVSPAKKQEKLFIDIFEYPGNAKNIISSGRILKFTFCSKIKDR
jgi:hypothetical protein